VLMINGYIVVHIP